MKKEQLKSEKEKLEMRDTLHERQGEADEGVDRQSYRNKMKKEEIGKKKGRKTDQEENTQRSTD